MTSYGENYDALPPGRWERRGPTLVYVEDGAAPTSASTASVSSLVPKPDKPAKALDVSQLIACPTCRAKVTESCRTRSGHTTKPHGSRLAPRLCPCGSLLAPRRRYCDPCRDRIDAENRYAGVVRFRAQQREAA